MSRAPLLSPSDAAKELCISEKQLRSLTCAGAIRYINIGLGEKRETRRYDPVDLEAMREPTEAMVEACGNGECGMWARGAWSLMIDGALSPQARKETET